MRKRDIIESSLREHIAALEHFPSKNVLATAQVLTSTLRVGGKVLVCGNGGSAADAQHFVGELVNRFRFSRDPLAALALTTDTGLLTAIGNDSDFQDIFARQVAALGGPGDTLVCISTSGQSENVIRAANLARDMGMSVIALTGFRGEKLEKCATVSIRISSDDTPRIQEMHVLVYHIICEIVEQELFLF